MELHRTVTIVDAVDAHVGAEFQARGAVVPVFTSCLRSVSQGTRERSSPVSVEEEALLLGCI